MEKVAKFEIASGSAYIPPAKLKMLLEEASNEDKKSEAYQRMRWMKLKKKICGQINRVNLENIIGVVRTILQENILRGKGVFARAVIQAQSFSPSYSCVFAALVAVINSKFPNVGELVLRRLIIQFKSSFRRNDKIICINVSKFIAHLANQRVCHEVLVLEILMVLMQNPTDDSIEVVVTLLRECGAMLQSVTPLGLTAVFERLRAILNDCDSIEKRTQYMIEIIFHIRKSKFKLYPTMPEQLDLIDEEDQIVHILELNPESGAYDPVLQLNVFKYDPDFEKNETEYEQIRKEIIGEESDDEDAASCKEEDTADDNGVSVVAHAETPIIDMTDEDMVAYRKNVYLTIQSSLDFQEAAHKLIKNELKPKMESELCHMIVDCCAQQRTYERFYGLLSERFCKLRKEFQECFEQIFKNLYGTIHRFDITKLRNMAKLMAHLLATDAIAWNVLSEIKLNEEDTTSSGRIFIKILFQETVEIMGLEKVYERTCDATLQAAFEGIFPRDHPKKTRFAINFFSLIGLAGLTLDLRDHLVSEEKLKKKKKDHGHKKRRMSSEK